MLNLDEGFPAWVLAAGVLVAVLSWAAMLRPALWLDADHLVLRNMLETIHIRLVAVEELAVRQVLVVRAGERRWVSTVVGRSLRKALFGSRANATGVHYADFVEERLRQHVDDARAALGVRAGSSEQLALPDAVRREPAWLPIALITLSLVGLLVLLFI